MFDVVCAMFSSFQLLGLWFESIGLTEVDRTQLLLLVVVVVVGCRLWVVGCGLWVVGCGTSRGARAGSCRAPARILSASASNPVFQHDVFQFL